MIILIISLSLSLFVLSLSLSINQRTSTACRTPEAHTAGHTRPDANSEERRRCCFFDLGLVAFKMTSFPQNARAEFFPNPSKIVFLQ